MDYLLMTFSALDSKIYEKFKRSLQIIDLLPLKQVDLTKAV